MIKFHNATGTDGHIIHIDEVTKENRAEQTSHGDRHLGMAHWGQALL